DVDGVDVVVPNHLHAEIGVAALERGKDVLLEKPMAATLADCDRLIAAERDSGRVLSIGHELRLSKQWGRVKALVDAGDVGEPRYAHVSLFRFPYRPGADGWRREPDRVGSWALEELVHHFDLLMWYFERWGEPVSVLSLGNASAGRDARMADNFSSLLRFRSPLYALVTKTVAAFEYHLALEITGTEGAIRAWWSGSMDRTRHAVFELKRGRRGGEPEVLPVEESGELFELEEELRQTVTA